MVEPHIEKYPCLCSGGDFCYIVRGIDTIDCSFPEEEEAEEYLEKRLHDKEMCKRGI